MHPDMWLYGIANLDTDNKWKKYLTEQEQSCIAGLRVRIRMDPHDFWKLHKSRFAWEWKLKSLTALKANLEALEAKNTVEPWRAMNGGLEAKNGALEGLWPVVAHFQHFGENPDPHLSDADPQPCCLVRKRVGSGSVLFPESKQILRLQNSRENRGKLEGGRENGKKSK